MTVNHEDRGRDTRFEVLLERSSLGARGATQLRERIPLAETKAVLSLSALPATPMESTEEFFKRYWPRLVHFLKSQASDSGLAEDVAGDAFVAVMDNWDLLLTYERPDFWLFKVAVRKLRKLEAQARARSLYEERASLEPDLQYIAATDEGVADHVDLVAAMRVLPRRQSEVVTLRWFGGYTVQETAEILGVTEGTVKKQLSRAMSRLRVLLQDGPEPSALRRENSS